MKALYLDEKLELRDIALPEPGRDQALVKVNMAGICNTDVELVKGYMGFAGVPGHEFVGVVEDGAGSWFGKRVCGEINFGCGACGYCARGLSRHCPNRSVMGILNQDGAFAEYVVVPVANLRQIPDSISDRSAVFVEPLAAAFEILEQIKIEPNHKVAVVGDGKLGLLICQVLRLTGCDLLLVGKHENKLAIARGWGVATTMPDSLDKSGFDVVVEASGAAGGFETAMQLLRPRGTMVLKSTYASELSLNAAPIVIDEISIIGSRCGQFEPAIRVLQQRLVTVDDMITATYPFGRALQAFEHAQKPGVLKILLQFDA